MENDRAFLAGLIVIAGLLSSGESLRVCWNAGEAGSVESRDQSKTASEAEDLLRKARLSLSGAARLESVRTLDVEGTNQRESEAPLPPGVAVFTPALEPFRFKVLWPDRFQFIGKWFIHTLNGPEFWMKQTGGPQVSATRDLEITARGSTERNAAALTLAFLLKTPPSLQMRPHYVGFTAVEGIAEDVIEFRGATGFGPKLVLDASQHVPLALITSVRRIEADGSEKVLPRVSRFDAYREVEGIRFPMRIDERSPGSHIVKRIDRIRVNLPLTRRDFAQGR